MHLQNTWDVSTLLQLQMVLNVRKVSQWWLMTTKRTWAFPTSNLVSAVYRVGIAGRLVLMKHDPSMLAANSHARSVATASENFWFTKAKTYNYDENSIFWKTVVTMLKIIYQLKKWRTTTKAINRTDRRRCSRERSGIVTGLPNPSERDHPHLNKSKF